MDWLDLLAVQAKIMTSNQYPLYQPIADGTHTQGMNNKPNWLNAKKMYSIMCCVLYSVMLCVFISMYVEICKTKKHIVSAIIWVRFIGKYTNVIFHDFKKYSLCMVFPVGTSGKEPYGDQAESP